MATLTIRNVPDDLHGRLKERAKRNRRRLNQEVIAELSEIGSDGEDDEVRIGRARERMREATAKIDEMRSRMPRFMSAEEIDKAIKEGRQ